MTDAEKSQLFAKMNLMQKMLEDQEEVFHIFIATIKGMNERLDTHLEICRNQNQAIQDLQRAVMYQGQRA